MRPLAIVSALVLLTNVAVAQTATLTGRVVMDSSKVGVINAEIAVQGVAKSAFSDDNGAFRLTGIPAGDQHVTVRHIGLAAIDTILKFVAGQTIEISFALGRAQSVAAVVTTALRGAEADFEDNRRLGLGVFFTRVELAKQEDRRLGDIMSQARGAGVIQGRAGQGWVIGKRRAPTIRPMTDRTRGSEPRDPVFYQPEPHERSQGMATACYAQVYLDAALMNNGKPTEPFDLNTIPVSTIESIEFYGGPAETPLKYAKLNSSCGVMVIHTRKPN